MTRIDISILNIPDRCSSPHSFSTGLGRELTLAALKRGDKVIATARARSCPEPNDIKAQGADMVELDVTDPLDKLNGIAKKAVGIHGRVDILVNNAGSTVTLTLKGGE